MALLEFDGKNLEEAIAAAAEALSLPAEKLKFTIASMGSRGFLGIGRKKAKIRINSDDQTNDAPDDLASNEASAESLWAGNGPKDKCTSEGLDFMRDSREPHKPPTPREKARERRPAKDRERPASPPRNQEPEDVAPPLDFGHLPPPLTQPAPGESFFTGEPDEVMREAREIAEGLVRRMGFSTEITVERIGSRVILKLADSADNALLIGSRGNTVEALELLVSRILSKKLKDTPPDTPEAADIRVVLDVADYRARRQTAILDTLRTIAAQVRRTRKPQTMNGLNSSERRLVQQALKPHRDLSSRNDAPRDCVVISPYYAKEKSTKKL